MYESPAEPHPLLPAATTKLRTRGRPWLRVLAPLAAFLLSSAAGHAFAQAQRNAGFSLLRFSPTPAGEWSFMVDHPWYSNSRYFAAAGITLDYAHDPLVFGVRSGTTFIEQRSVIQHQLVG